MPNPIHDALDNAYAASLRFAGALEAARALAHEPTAALHSLTGAVHGPGSALTEALTQAIQAITAEQTRMLEAARAELENGVRQQ